MGLNDSPANHNVAQWFIFGPLAIATNRILNMARRKTIRPGDLVSVTFPAIDEPADGFYYPEETLLIIAGPVNDEWIESSIGGEGAARTRRDLCTLVMTGEELNAAITALQASRRRRKK